VLFLFARTYKKTPEQSLLCSGMVPVTGLEPVRCRQRRILSGYIDSVFRSNLHSTVPWKR